MHGILNRMILAINKVKPNITVRRCYGHLFYSCAFIFLSSCCSYKLFSLRHMNIPLPCIALHSNTQSFLALSNTSINSSSPCVAYMRQWIGSALAQIMAYAYSAPSHYLNQWRVIVNWIFRNKLRLFFVSKHETFHSQKYIWKYRLWKGGNFVQGVGGGSVS